MKKSNSFYFSFCIFLLSTFLFSSQLNSQTLVFDFEAPATSDALANGIGFDGCTIDGVVADPVNPNNNVLQMTKGISTQIWAGIKTLPTPGIIDLTTDHEICVDFYELDATGTLRIKLENPSNGGPIWELEVNTTMGWGNYCFNTNIGNPAAGFIYETLVIFPDFGTCCTNQIYYLDNVYVNPILCDLLLSSGSATCDAMTSGVDTYEATIPFSQTAAPGAGTYTLTTTSGGTIGGDDPNLLAAGTITLTGVTEGTLADLNVSSTNCNLNSSVASPACVPDYNLTFVVDMCEQINLGNFDPTTQGLYVAGGNIYPMCGALMTDGDGDNVYELVRPYPDGTTVNYKFLIGDIAWANTGSCTGAGFEPNLSAPCGFGNFGDRQYIIAGVDATIPEVCFGSCTACTTCTCDLMLLAGTATCDAMTAGTDTYEATYTFSQTTAPGAGTFTMTTTSGGTIGGDDPNTMTSGTITISGISEGTDADINIADGAGCNLDVTVTSPACVAMESVEFNVDMSCMDPVAAFTTVHITGPFCGWCSGGFDLTDTDGDGIWTGVFDFLPGNLEFKYMVDGFASQENLVDDMQNAGTCAPITDFSGFANREIAIVAGGPNVTNDSYGSCESCCAASHTLTATETGAADYESSGNISSISIIQSMAVVDYDSATDIDLNPGFEVVLGAVFEAFIDGCNGGMGGSN